MIAFFQLKQKIGDERESSRYTLVSQILALIKSNLIISSQRTFYVISFISRFPTIRTSSFDLDREKLKINGQL